MLRIPTAVTALALVGWTASALLMRGMSGMSGPGPLPSFLWLWAAMSAAMMLPSVVPATSLAARVGRSGTAFVGAYLAVWCATGLAAYEAARLLAATGRAVTVAVVVTAAAYQLTPLKDACLRRCRGPLGSLLRRGGFGAGLEHGTVCVGCCWALMLALLALGADSVYWMAAVAAVILLEKATPVGRRAPAPVALALLGAAAWVAL
jgi:predicted metal-binding membrane protein